MNIHASKLITGGDIRRINLNRSLILIHGAKIISSTLQTLQLEIASGEGVNVANAAQDYWVCRIKIAGGFEAFYSGLILASLELYRTETVPELSA